MTAQLLLVTLNTFPDWEKLAPPLTTVGATGLAMADAEHNAATAKLSRNARLGCKRVTP